MKVLFFCPHWGRMDDEFEDFLRDAKLAGYDGVELPFVSLDRQFNADRIQQVTDRGLLWIGQHWETASTNFGIHKNQYLSRLEAMAIHHPFLINAHTGRDFFTFEQNMTLIRAAGELANNYDLNLCHETHRSRFNFAAHITKPNLLENKELRLTADFSHWVCVAETMLSDQQEALDLAITRADHIHARVGFVQGPQIPDPRAAEWQSELKTFLGWWDSIVERARQQQRKHISITPEFGPYPYMQIIPHTKEPLTNQWDVNKYMRDLLDERYNQS